MTKDAVEFIAEACIRDVFGRPMDHLRTFHALTEDLASRWREVARLAVRMAVAWEAMRHGEDRAAEPLSRLPMPLFNAVRFNTERGTLDRPTMPEEVGS